MNGSAPVTLEDLAEDGLSVFCWCNACSHSAIIDVVALCRVLDPRLPVPMVAEFVRCGRCGAKNVATRPAWPSLGQVTQHG